MTYTEWTRSLELTHCPLTITESDKWLWDFSHPIDTVPKVVRYRNHPRVGPSNPQLPRSRYNKAFRGHLFRVGRSKK